LKPLSKIGFRAYPPSATDFFAQTVVKAVEARRSGTDAQVTPVNTVVKDDSGMPMVIYIAMFTAVD
jgi:hypothetical protein